MPDKDQHEGSLAILGGCGHVGLPLGITFAAKGIETILVDRDPGRIARVNDGEMPFLELGAPDVLKDVVKKKLLRATDRSEDIALANTVVVTIGTPVDEFLDPSVRQFDASMLEVAQHLRRGQLLVLRSTVFPGVTEHLSRLFAAQGVDIDLTYCPERIAQGYAMDELKNLPQIISGTTDRAVKRAKQLFNLIAPSTITLKPVEAELAKLFTNASRYINFAISNQFYILANQFEADFMKIYQAMRQDYPRMSGFSRAGFAAGPCLLKDTMQLSAFNHGAFPLGQAAMLVNESLPYHIMQQIKSERDLASASVGILGMAFKANNDDPRSSLSYKLRKVLSLECREVLCTDPYIDDPSFCSLEDVLERADVLVVGASHDEYKKLATSKPIIDISNSLNIK